MSGEGGSDGGPMNTPLPRDQVVNAEEYERPIPAIVHERSKEIVVEERAVTVDLHRQTWKVVYREAFPIGETIPPPPQPSSTATSGESTPSSSPAVTSFPTDKTVRKGRGLETYVSEEVLPPVVLLHGPRYTSWLWEDGEDMHLVAGLGHRVIAPDLPGCGDTTGPAISTQQKGEFLARFLYRVRLNTSLPIIISPCGGEPYSLPYLLGASRRVTERRVSAALLVSPGWPRALLDKSPAPTHIPTLVLVNSNFPGWRKAQPRIQATFPQARYLAVTGIKQIDYPAQWQARTTIINFLIRHDASAATSN